ncbi:MAG: malate dehydrogenase [Candidatus Binatia bacterium]
MRKKVTIVGAGNVGATTAQRIFDRGYADVVLVDIIPDLPQGKALDILESGPVIGSDARIVGSNSYGETANSDLVIITSGVPRKPGMSRDDLLFTNLGIVKNVTKEIVRYSPKAVIIVVTNPLDAITQAALEVSRFPRSRLFGMAGVLDTARFRAFIASELKVSVEEVQAYVLGGHGDSMVPLVRYTTVAGVPLMELLPRERVEELVQRTRGGGGEIVKLLKTGSAFYTPSAAITQMAESVLLDRKRILPCCTYLEGEYGIHNLCVGVPCKLGAGGVEEVIQIPLASDEKAALEKSTTAVRELIDVMHKPKVTKTG